MPNPHFDIRIIQRSEGQSAVAAAAYQSGKKLYSEYDQAVKHYSEKRGILHSEILLPSHAPPEYADENTLWNAVEKIEKQWNSQLARRFEIALPKEIPAEQYADLVRDYCREFFVSQGMCVDFAIHDPYPPGHNPHAHLMLTLRAIDEHGKWLPKSKKVYDLDENGNRVRLPSGRWKSHKETTVDWNEQFHGEEWRQGWADWQNRYLERNNRPERVDLRSYERQGIDKIPTVHMGAAVTAMERRGIQTDIGNLNREIRTVNRLMHSIKQFIRDLKSVITELRQEEKDLRAQRAIEEAGSLPALLMKYMDIRKEERKDWTPYGRQKATAQDLKKVTSAIAELDRLGLHSVDDLECHIEKSGEQSNEIHREISQKEKRVKEIKKILSAQSDMADCMPFYDEYRKIYFKKSKEKYKQEHPQVGKFFRAKAYLEKHTEGQPVDADDLNQEKEQLAQEIAEGKVPLTRMTEDLKRLEAIRHWVRKATPGTEESREAPQKQSVLNILSEPKKQPKAQQTEKKEKDMER